MARKPSFKILAINWQDITNPLGGGAEVHFHEIFKRVAAAGHAVTLLCCHYRGASSEETIDGIHIVRHGRRNLFNFYVPWAYRELKAQADFDVVVDDINKIPFFTPLFVKEPIVAIIHHFFSRTIYLEVPFLPASYVYYSERLVPLVYRHTPFAAVSESTRKELCRVGIRSRIDLLPNAVDLADYTVVPNSKSEKPLIGYLGRVKKYKSLDHILQAMPGILSHDPRVRLLIIGDGDYRPALERLASSLGIERNVTFARHVSQAEKVKFLNKLWLGVNPSPKEGWGLTVIEANACGVPVIAADSPGLRDSVVHGKTGILFKYGDIHGLTKETVALLENHQKRNDLTIQARQWAEKFSWDESAQRAIEIINATVSR
ncbi:glycosyltransferase family 4 protein [candidate division KSB1 bacterium]|nr:glycosyltransferase family 4 protein [candidate division KSB1 bacterium]